MSHTYLPLPALFAPAEIVPLHTAFEHSLAILTYVCAAMLAILVVAVTFAAVRRLIRGPVPSPAKGRGFLIGENGPAPTRRPNPPPAPPRAGRSAPVQPVDPVFPCPPDRHDFDPDAPPVSLRVEDGTVFHLRRCRRCGKEVDTPVGALGTPSPS